MTKGDQRPLGLVVIVVITLFSGILTLLLGGFGLFLAPAADRVEGWLLAGLLLAFVIGVLETVAAYGLWSFQDWALGFARVVYGLGIAVNLLGLLVDHAGPAVFVSLLWVAAAVCFLRYLSKPEIARLYGAHVPRPFAPGGRARDADMLARGSFFVSGDDGKP